MCGTTVPRWKGIRSPTSPAAAPQLHENLSQHRRITRPRPIPRLSFSAKSWLEINLAYAVCRWRSSGTVFPASGRLLTAPISPCLHRSTHYGGQTSTNLSVADELRVVVFPPSTSYDRRATSLREGVVRYGMVGKFEIAYTSGFTDYCNGACLPIHAKWNTRGQAWLQSPEA